MADRLLLYYKYVGAHSGLAGKMRLAQLTKLPSTKAALAPDDPDTLRAFRTAVEEITGKPAPTY